MTPLVSIEDTDKPICLTYAKTQYLPVTNAFHCVHMRVLSPRILVFIFPPHLVTLRAFLYSAFSHMFLHELSSVLLLSLLRPWTAYYLELIKTCILTSATMPITLRIVIVLSV
jgi:hypothetical protein